MRVCDRVTTERARMVDRNLELLGEFGEAIFAEPGILDEIPNGATLVLSPDDDAEFIETNFRIGLAAVRRGKYVYFVYVTRNSGGQLVIKQRDGAVSPDPVGS